MRRGEIAGEAPGVGMRARLGACVVMAAVCGVAWGADRGRKSHATVPRAYAEARDLFNKVWEPGAPGEAGGDGLGPLYNDNSCVGCHHLGGVGGGGDNRRNVVILTAFAGPPRAGDGRHDRVFQGELEDLHPGLRTRTSVVLHRHATSPADEARLERMRKYEAVQTRDDLVALRTTERNTPALFGAGLIDAIPDGVLVEAGQTWPAEFPEVKGRVSRLRDGRIGRFGWKGQTATLRDFVLAACSNELGLEVPGHHQASLAPARDFRPSDLKLDLDEPRCDLLTRFVRSLPRPVLRPVGNNPELAARGLAVFKAVGCATCHAPRLGPVNGLFSDLLLHDLGDRLTASGGYGTGSRVVDLAETDRKAKNGPPPTGEAGPTEWRTPPLWGVADSAPYLHDGRASTLDEAIRLHGGEADAISKRYAKLDRADRQALLAFLRSLTAPPGLPRVADSSARQPPRDRARGPGFWFTWIF
jgi:CxxC motif-containing protein (DUF1111 family)